MAPRDKGEQAKQEKAGITERGVKKTIWFHEDEAEALRLKDTCIKNGTMVLEVNHETSRIGGLAGGSATSGAGAVG
jgi:hypothetical protein